MANSSIGALNAQWQRGKALFYPAFALACGVIASGRLSALQIIPVLIAVIIAVGLWPAFWIALAETNWAVPLSRWQAWNKGAAFPSLPYAVPGSDADQLVIILGKFRAWAIEDLLPNYGNTLLVVICAPVVALILASAIGVGAPAVGLTIVAICIPQIAVLAARGNGQPNPIWRGMIDIALPILLGCSLLRVIPVELIVVAVGFAVAYTGAASGRSWTWNIGLAIVMALLMVTRHPVGVFGVGLFWLPQFLKQAQPGNRRAMWWLDVSILIAALVLA